MFLAELSAEEFAAAARESGAYALAERHLDQWLSTVITRHERVLLCYPDEGEGSIGRLAAQAVRHAQGIPVFWEKDCRWKTLLRQAFTSHVTTVMGSPLTVLGLTKLARATHTPLFIKNAVLAGGACEDWMQEGIRNGLDAKLWGCYDPIPGAVIAGVSCAQSRGVHVCTEAFSAHIEDGSGRAVPAGARGRVILHLADRPEIFYDTGETGKLILTPCGCGNPAPQLVDFHREMGEDLVLRALRENLLSWGSVLDCRAVKTAAGLELEVVCFPGLRLPPMPACARRVVRCWDPDTDVPFA